MLLKSQHSKMYISKCPSICFQLKVIILDFFFDFSIININLDTARFTCIMSYIEGNIGVFLWIIIMRSTCHDVVMNSQTVFTTSMTRSGTCLYFLNIILNYQLVSFFDNNTIGDLTQNSNRGNLISTIQVFQLYYTVENDA